MTIYDHDGASAFERSRRAAYALAVEQHLSAAEALTRADVAKEKAAAAVAGGRLQQTAEGTESGYRNYVRELPCDQVRDGRSCLGLYGHVGGCAFYRVTGLVAGRPVTWLCPDPAAVDALLDAARAAGYERVREDSPAA